MNIKRTIAAVAVATVAAVGYGDDAVVVDGAELEVEGTGAIAQGTLDLSEEWTVTSFDPMDVPYSAVGWGIEENGNDATVTLELTWSDVVDTVTEIASGLTGRGTNSWDTTGYPNKPCVLRHYVLKNGSEVMPDETLEAHLVISRQLRTLAAVAAAVFPDDGRPCAITEMTGPNWMPVRYDGEGAVASADGTSTLTFALDGIGTFAFEYRCAAGETLTVAVDGDAAKTLAAAADWTPARFVFGDVCAHTVVISATGGGTAVRGVRWDDGTASGGAVAQHELDLSDVWDKRNLNGEPILWSSLGWEDVAEAEGGKTVTLRLIPLSAGEEQTLRSGLTGHRQTDYWTPGEVTKQVYNIRHVVVGGSPMETDLNAYFSFENYDHVAPSEADVRAAIRFGDGTGWDFGIANDAENWWDLAGGPGEGIEAPEGASTLTFTVDGHGTFLFDYALAGGAWKVKVDGVEVRTMDAAEGWTGAELSMDERLVTHVIEFETELSNGDTAALKNVRWVDADDCFGGGEGSGGAADLREGVLVVRRSNELMPFTWSSTNFTGNALVKNTGFISIDPQSVASVRIVQVTGEGEDVSQWTTEDASTAKTLVAEKQGESTVKWKGVRQGVWKAELIITPPAGEGYRETRILDLRRYIGQGTVFFLR